MVPSGLSLQQGLLLKIGVSIERNMWFQRLRGFTIYMLSPNLKTVDLRADPTWHLNISRPTRIRVGILALVNELWVGLCLACTRHISQTMKIFGSLSGISR